MRKTALLFGMMLVALLLASGVAVAATLKSTSDLVPQTNGRVTAIAVSGNTIYLGGSFTSVGGVARSRLAAINANTGVLTDWAPHVSRPVSALAVDGNTVYAGGAFNKAGGRVHNYVAAIEASGTGRVIHAFDAGANLPVRALAASGGTLYLGGDFTEVKDLDGVPYPRSSLAAIDADGNVLDWDPGASGPVRALELSGSRLYVGGDFTRISGQTTTPNLAALVASTGTADTTWLPQWPNVSRPVYDVEAPPATGSVYVAGGGAGGEGVAFSSASGAHLWSTGAWDGDFQAVAYLDGQVYFGGHFRVRPADETRRQKLLAVDTDGALQGWRPKASGGGVWAVEADAPNTRIYAGGDFTKISGRIQEGFARFSP